jgi:heptosyltransferase-2
MSLIGGARALVSHDSGAMHIAYLMGTPLISLFGATLPSSRLPTAYKDAALSVELPCIPCYDGKNYANCSSNICLQMITPDMVIEKILLLI